MPCPGYPQTRDAIFRHANVRAVHEASAGAFVGAAAVIEERTSADNSNAAENRVDFLPIHSPLRLSDTITSTYYFMHQVVIPVGWFPLIPQLYQESGPGGCLKWAVDAASMFLFANRTGKDQLLVQARNLYSLALNAINLAISDPFERLKDETFCAILILNIIDVSTNEIQSSNSDIDQPTGYYWGQELHIR